MYTWVWCGSVAQHPSPACAPPGTGECRARPRGRPPLPPGPTVPGSGRDDMPSWVTASLVWREGLCGDSNVASFSVVNYYVSFVMFNISIGPRHNKLSLTCSINQFLLLNECFFVNL